MSCNRPARQSGIHRSIPFQITEIEGGGFWRYSFSIGSRDFSGTVQATLGLLAARRVKMKIDRVLGRHVSMEIHANAVTKPKPPRNPRPSLPAKPTDPPRNRPALPMAGCSVAFTCEACKSGYEAVQVLVAAKGVFRCIVCYWPIHQWDGPHDYTCWRRLAQKK